MHVYVVQDWIELLILIFLECLIEGGFANILIRIIMDAFTHNGNVAKEEIANKFLSFGANGVSMFQVSFWVQIH
jgi:hypothetical protein